MAKMTKWLLMAGLAVSGCSLPRPGPSISEITDNESGLPIVSVTLWNEGNDPAPPVPETSTADWLIGAPPYAADRVLPGDQLSVLIVESSSNGAFLQTLSSPLLLEGLVVEEDGTVHLPYAGTVRVEGHTPSEIAVAVAAEIDRILYRPQVQVSRVGPSRHAVTVVGENGGTSFELGVNRDSLVDALLVSGMPLSDDATYEVEVRRADRKARIPYRLVLQDPRYDVPLRPGDVVRLVRSNTYFTVLGSVGDGRLFNLPSEGRNLLQALGMARGLEGNTADPRGVFVFRRNKAGDAVIYHMDMSRPGDIFAGNEFPVRDGDVIYVSYAPFAQTQKVLRAISGTLSMGGAAAQISR